MIGYEGAVWCNPEAALGGDLAYSVAHIDASSDDEVAAILVNKVDKVRSTKWSKRGSAGCKQNDVIISIFTIFGELERRRFGRNVFKIKSAVCMRGKKKGR